MLCFMQRVTLDTVMARSDLASTVHPAVLQLGLRYADGSIKGANARCIAMLDMLHNMVQDYETPAGQPCAVWYLTFHTDTLHVAQHVAKRYTFVADLS